MNESSRKSVAQSVTKSVSLVIKGHVQGVWYRASACDRARALGLGGFVRNLADGSVAAEAEGPAAAVEAFIDWCRVGPPRARVDDVSVTENAPSGRVGFDVR